MARKKLTMLLQELVTALLFIFMFSPFYILIVNAFKNRFQVLTDVMGLPEDWGQISANLKAVLAQPKPEVLVVGHKLGDHYGLLADPDRPAFINGRLGAGPE
jgi:ABC-type glycerol-3-phosphate transport system permease component